MYTAKVTESPESCSKFSMNGREESSLVYRLCSGVEERAYSPLLGEESRSFWEALTLSSVCKPSVMSRALLGSVGCPTRTIGADPDRTEMQFPVCKMCPREH